MTGQDGHECVTCHRRTARPGCCWRCVDRARERLTELHRLVLLLRQAPSLRAQQLTMQESRGSGGPGSVLNLEVADLIGRHGVQAVMLEWCRYISETRSVTEIQDPYKHPRGDRKCLWDASIAFLDTHMEWLSQQGDIWNDFLAETTAPWVKLRQIVYGDRRPPRPVPCPVLDCTGTIHLHPNGDAQCRDHPDHHWPYDNWSQLARLVAQEHQ